MTEEVFGKRTIPKGYHLCQNPRCFALVSDKAESCPDSSCGWKNPHYQKQESRKAGGE